MYPEKKGGSHKMARPQQIWGLLTLLTKWASIWTMPNTASPKSEPPCGRAVYTPVRATILGHPPQKTAPGGISSQEIKKLLWEQAIQIFIYACDTNVFKHYLSTSSVYWWQSTSALSHSYVNSLAQDCSNSSAAMDLIDIILVPTIAQGYPACFTMLSPMYLYTTIPTWVSAMLLMCGVSGQTNRHASPFTSVGSGVHSKSS